MKDQVQAVQNFKNAAHYDLKTVKIVMPDSSAHSVVKAAKRIIAAMEEFTPISASRCTTASPSSAASSRSPSAATRGRSAS